MIDYAQPPRRLRVPTAAEQDLGWQLWCAVWRWWWAALPGARAEYVVFPSVPPGAPVQVGNAVAAAAREGVLSPDEAAFLRYWIAMEALRAGLGRAGRLGRAVWTDIGWLRGDDTNYVTAAGRRYDVRSGLPAWEMMVYGWGIVRRTQ